MEQKKRKIPLRQCLGCNEHKPKSELLRVVRSPEGEVSLDFTGKKSGRGAYICHDTQCLKKAIKSKAIERAFGLSVPEEIFETLSIQMEEGDDE